MTYDKTILEKEKLLRDYFNETHAVIKRQIKGEIRLSEALSLIEQIKTDYGITDEILRELAKILK